jgi:hypothetical protein
VILHGFEASYSVSCAGSYTGLTWRMGGAPACLAYRQDKNCSLDVDVACGRQCSLTYIEDTLMQCDNTANGNKFSTAVLETPAKNIIQPSLLVSAIEIQRHNQESIENIAVRINKLIDHLTGPTTQAGAACGDITGEPAGFLLAHRDALDYEARCIGELQADLARLEALL